MARTPNMLGDVCPCCMRIHPSPACNHDSTAPCIKCGLPFGYLTNEMSMDGPCWFCVMQHPRPTKSTLGPVEVDEVFL